LQRAKSLDPSFWFNSCFLGRAYEAKGRLPEAISEFKHALELEKDNPETWASLGNAYAVSGQKTEALKTLDYLKQLSLNNDVAPYNEALIYAGLGDKDLTFALLDQAYKERSYYLAEYLVADARLDILHSDPRFRELLRKVGLPQ
jgi:tetratricopeptide (TPR) repeat protein